MNHNRWTQRMTMHLNGGSEWSGLTFAVFCDDEPTDIVRVTRTNGSPEYLKTVDQLQCGDEVFDILATKGEGVLIWLEAHRPEKAPKPVE
jgi:hypothetical protein